MYGLSEDDLRIRDTARAFVESLMPHEVEAEMAGGLLPKELTAEHSRRAIELGLYATNMPTSVGGRGCTALQQVLVQEQCGRVTNGLAWVMATPPQWWPEVATDYQRERWLLPSVRGEKHEAYAITEEFAGSDVAELQTTARRDGDEYVINGVKWHVTSFNLADYVFVEAVLTTGEHAGDHVLLVVDLPWPGMEVVRTPHYSHNIADEHPIVAFNDVRVPASNLVGAEGEPMTFTQDWFRFERMMVASRCVGAAQRLVDEMTAFAQTPRSRRQAARRAPAGGGHAGRQCDRAVRRPAPCSTRWPGRSTRAATARFCTARRPWPSCTAPRWPVGSRTAPCRCSAAAATCARTSPSGCSASFGWNGSGKAPARFSGSSLLAR